MAYRFLAYDAQGQPVRGKLDLPTEEAVEQYLWRQRYTVVEIAPTRERPDLTELFPTFLGVSTQQVVTFSRRLSTLLRAGIPLLQSLRILHEDASSGRLRRVLARIMEELQEGKSLAQALDDWPRTFPKLYVELVRVGEETGNLDEVLAQAAEYLEREVALRRKIQGALAYPLLILTIAAGLVALVVTVTLPRLIDILASLSVDLPLPTRLLIGFTQFVNNNRSELTLGLALGLIAVAWFVNTRPGRRIKDRLLLKLPLIKVAVLEGDLSRVSRASALLLGAGHPLPDVISIGQEVSGNVHLQDAYGRVRQGLIRGEGMSRPMAKEGLFPVMYVQMIRVGEETGTLETQLLYMAGFYEEETDRAVAALTGALEPALVIFVGGVVAFIALSIVMPLYSLLGGLH